MSTPLIMDENVRARIASLVAYAQAHPVNMLGLTELLEKPDAKEMHMAQMTAQTMEIPMAFLVTFSIEINHPIGTCRHLSMSVMRERRIPHPIAVWMVAKEFDFWGEIEQCDGVWEEELTQGTAINVVQKMEEPK